MKKLLLGGFVLALTAGSAMAADMRVKAPPLAAPAFSWNGCYVGVEGGYAWGRSRHVSVGAPGFGGLGDFTPSFNVTGGLAGGEVGCNAMLTGTSWVFGVESDFSWTNKKGSAFETGPAGFATFTFQDTTRERWISTSRMRIGPSWGALWIYATGGFASARVEAQVAVPFGTFGPLAATTFYDNNYLYGWTAGAGFESALWNTWSWKVEYLYVRLENQTFRFLGQPVAPRGALNLDDHIVRVGLNWRFMGLGFLAP
jgi:outer membrane immunogenic protein